ncbi:MAG TPA: hypothetical protein VN193_06235 [Candidatus Angelobacter sp.]|jgi:hypothetical protein|nr:hypothetical protein [Candidatus Angelobacter sp.]
MAILAVVPAFVIYEVEASHGPSKATWLDGLASFLCYGIWLACIVAVVRNRLHPARRRRQMKAAQREFERAFAAATAAYERACAEWELARQEYDAAEAARIHELPLYSSVSFISRPRRIDVFGDAGCWRDFLATVCGSLVGAGSTVTLLDFSEAGAATRLMDLCIVAGIPNRVLTLPDEIARCDVMAGLNPAEIADVIVESLYSGVDHSTREERSLATRLLSDVTTILQADFTMTRLWSGAALALGHQQAPGMTNALSTAEVQRLRHLYPHAFRSTMGSRLIQLENQLHALRALGQNPPAQTTPAPRVDILVIGRGGRTIENELLRDLIVEGTVRHLRRDDAGAAPPMIIVAGADQLSERQLRRLDQQAAASGSRLILLFRELAGNALDFLGAGGAVAFFRLTNATQAERAANWIGRDYRFVLGELTEERASAQASRMESERIVVTGRHHSTKGAIGASVTPGQPIGFFIKGGSEHDHMEATRQRTASSAVEMVAHRLGATMQRVHEHVVDPQTLRTLPPNTLLLAEFDPRSGRRVVAADCSPELALDPRVSPEAR